MKFNTENNGDKYVSASAHVIREKRRIMRLRLWLMPGTSVRRPKKRSWKGKAGGR